MSFSTEYSRCWKDTESLLIYKSNDFQFKSSVIITELENCLIKKISVNKLYHAMNPKDISVYNEAFVKKIMDESKDHSIIIMSNQLNKSKLNIDNIKKKMELFIEKYKFPILAMFSLKPNKFSKPHTGMWKFLKYYYNSIGQSQINKAVVVSDYGGRVIEQEKGEGDIKVTYDSTDMDRSFAFNIDVPFRTILEYITPDKKEKYIWNKKTIPPEIRELFAEKLSKCKSPNIFAKLAELGEHEAYMIMIYGAPRAGKTTLAKSLVKLWRKSSYAKNHEILRLGLDKFTDRKRIRECEKVISSRISVIIDGGCHSAILRKSYVEIAKKYNTPILYIEVTAGLAFAYIFNHVAVEEAHDENTILYDDKEYRIYKSNLQRPDNVVLYAPVIKKTMQVMEFRY